MQLHLEMNETDKLGLPPGSLVHVGARKTDQVQISMMVYNTGEYSETEAPSPKQYQISKDSPSVSWISVNGLHDIAQLEAMGSHFGLHHLLLEDILNTGQRPKMDEFAEHLFITFKLLQYDVKASQILEEQISLVLGENFVISFTESPRGLFDPIRERIRKDRGRVRKMGADYLIYLMLDIVVDHYFVLNKQLEDEIDEKEDELMARTTPKILQELYVLKKQVLYLNRLITPLEEVLRKLMGGETGWVAEDILFYYRDLHDHCKRVTDTLGSHRDEISAMVDMYLSIMGNKTNEIMKLLAIIATIFMPLTFIAGIYGMNFEHMPELKWMWGYPFALVLMTMVGVGIWLFIRKRKWL